MTTKEACIHALEELGGKAPLNLIYPRVMEKVSLKGDTPKNTIRARLQSNPDCFRPSGGKRGWWELVSYQEEVAMLKARIADLEEENRRLKKMETADKFVERMVDATKNLFGVNRRKADNVRVVLLKLNRTEEQQDLLDWITNKREKEEKKTARRIIQKISNSQVFNGQITNSDFNGGRIDNER